MKIVLIGGVDTDCSPSMAHYARHLYQALTDLYGVDHPISFRQGQGLNLPSFAAKIPCGKSWALDLSRHVLYPRQLKGSDADVYHILDHSYAHLAGRLPPERTVVTCHDLIPLGFPDMWRTWVSRNTGLRWFKRSLQGLSQVQRIMADSWATRGSLQRYDPMVGQKTVVVPLGISPVFRPARDEAERALLRDKYNLRSDMRYVLHVGRCWRYKNIEGLLRVFAKTDQKCSTRCMLLRVGETLSEEHRRLADHLHIATQVHEMGSMSTEGLAELYRAADVLLFPSRYEGFGLPVLEAMASGLPVVASNVASLPEVAGEAALLLSPDDYDGLAGAVCRVLEDVGLREALRAKGLAQAREFSWEKCARETMAVYEEVCR